jgi:hypothetical protein
MDWIGLDGVRRIHRPKQINENYGDTLLKIKSFSIWEKLKRKNKYKNVKTKW